MPFETNVTTCILEYLNSVPGCIAEKVLGSAASKNRSDISGCYKGRAFRFEVKTGDHGYGATTGQRINLMRWAHQGALCAIIYSIGDARCLINPKGRNLDGFKGEIIQGRSPKELRNL